LKLDRTFSTSLNKENERGPAGAATSADTNKHHRDDMSTRMANKFMNFAIITPDDQQQL